MQHKETPHMKIALEMTFPVGNLTRMSAVMGCMARIPKYRTLPSHEYCGSISTASKQTVIELR
jgi:hypothetical protein